MMTDDLMKQLNNEFVFGQVFPLDAGTDNGFTFTSPNWETEPRAEVFTIIITFTTVDIIIRP